MEKLWFKRKKYGWGWTPCRWQGWFVVVFYLLFNLGMYFAIDTGYHQMTDTVIGFSFVFLASTLALFAISYMKGEKPRWQWGDEDTKKDTTNHES